MPETTISADGAVGRGASPYVARRTSCLPLLRVYRWAESAEVCRWPQAEEGFLDGLWKFDQELTAGRMGKRANQSGKTGFFIDMLTLLLARGSNNLQRRRVVPGLFFPEYILDAAYPETGLVEVMFNAKAADGESSSGRLGRGPGRYWVEWIKEAGLKTIDLKAEWARNAGLGGGPTSDLITWLRQSKPRSFLFLAIRVMDANDLDRTLLLANAANQMMDGVGLVAYEVNPLGNGYQACRIPPHLELDRTLSRVCTALRNLP